jgi:Calcineurin-like phosphoesterase superfamily domain
VPSAPRICSDDCYGHLHKPSIEHRDGVLYLNPGSAGPRRFKLPVTVAKMSVVNGELTRGYSSWMSGEIRKNYNERLSP